MSTIVFQPMVLPTTPTMAKPLQFEHPGAKFRGASVEVCFESAWICLK